MGRKFLDKLIGKILSSMTTPKKDNLSFTILGIQEGMAQLKSKGDSLSVSYTGVVRVIVVAELYFPFIIQYEHLPYVSSPDIF